MRKHSDKTRRTRRHLRARGGFAIRRILVPLDFSGFARQALMCAVPLARTCRARIDLVHVVRPPAVLPALPGDAACQPVGTERLVGVCQTHLDDLAAQLLPATLRGQSIVREGNPADEVVAAARMLQAELIVLSNTGLSGLKRLVLGSTAERIVRHAHCPVLTVRRQRAGPAMRLLALEKPLYPQGLPWRRMLVPLDFSLTSLKALGVAVPLAKLSGSRLVLLHVIEPNPYATGMEGAVLVLPDATLARNARSQLAHVANRFIPKSVRHTALIGWGRAADVILETAEKENVDLIVLSTHGHTGWDRLLLGSTAEQIVRQAGHPVLVVRKPHDSKGRP